MKLKVEMNSSLNSKQKKLLQLWFFSKSLEHNNIHKLFLETNTYLEEYIYYKSNKSNSPVQLAKLKQKV